MNRLERRHRIVRSYLCYQAEDGIRYLVRSRGLGDVYKRQVTILRGAGADAVVVRLPGRLVRRGTDLVREPEVLLSLIHI